MSKLGKELIGALKEAIKKGCATLQSSTNVGKLKKKVNRSQQGVSAAKKCK